MSSVEKSQRASFNENDSDDGNSDEDYIKQELSDIPLGELQEIRHKLGTKKFDAVLKKSQEEREARSFKRANKNRPSEVSSKKRVSRFREVVPVAKKKEVPMDPRFDERAGTLNEDLFKKSFAFVEELKKKEKKQVQKEANKTRNPERKAQLQRLIQQIESREEAAAKEEERKSLLREHKKAERDLIKEGKKPFYIKKSTQKKLELARKYSDLKRSGKLEKFLTKRRKKTTSRDRKRLPLTGARN